MKLKKLQQRLQAYNIRFSRYANKEVTATRQMMIDLFFRISLLERRIAMLEAIIADKQLQQARKNRIIFQQKPIEKILEEIKQEKKSIESDIQALRQKESKLYNQGIDTYDLQQQIKDYSLHCLHLTTDIQALERAISLDNQKPSQTKQEKIEEAMQLGTKHLQIKKENPEYKPECPYHDNTFRQPYLQALFSEGHFLINFAA